MVGPVGRLGFGFGSALGGLLRFLGFGVGVVCCIPGFNDLVRPWLDRVLKVPMAGVEQAYIFILFLVVKLGASGENRPGWRRGRRGAVLFIVYIGAKGGQCEFKAHVG